MNSKDLSASNFPKVVITVVVIVFIGGLLYLVYDRVISPNLNDGQKKSNIDSLASSIRNYKSNHGNKLPQNYARAWQNELLSSSYLKQKLINPVTKSEYKYRVVTKKSLTNQEIVDEAMAEDYIFIDPHHQCSEGGVQKKLNSVALRVLLNDKTVYCQTEG